MLFSLIYTLFCILVILVSLILNNKIVGKRLSLAFLFITTFVISAIRCNSGSDYYNYFVSFNQTENFYHSLSDIVSSNYQFGITLISFIIKKLTDNEYAMFVIIAFFVSFVSNWFIKKYSQLPIMSYAIFLLGGFFLMSTNILKQIIAMMIILIAIDRFLRKEYVRFCALVIIASFFHIISLVSIIIIPFSSIIKINRRTLLVGGFSSFLLGVFSDKILQLFLKIPLFSRYERYFTDQLAIGFDDIKLILNALFVSVTLFFLLYFLIGKIEKKKVDVQESFFLRLIIIGFFIACFSINFYYLLRISYFYTQLLIVLVPNLIVKIRDIRIQKKYWISTFFLLVIFSFLFSALSGENNYYNYSTIFNDVPMSVREFVIYGGN